MRPREGYGKTWLTDNRRAAEVPGRTLAFTFVGTAVVVTPADYFISGRESVWLSIGLGIACGLIVSWITYRGVKPFRSER
jgi:amino acid transporter